MRFSTNHRDKPAPNQYQTNATSMYSKIIKSRKRLGDAASNGALGSAKRLTYFEPSSSTPGPGEYQAPSAFGQYLAKAAAEQQCMTPQTSLQLNRISSNPASQ